MHWLRRMIFQSGRAVILAAFGAIALCGAPRTSAALERQDAVDRALAFLGREVPLWRTENHCFSCHNNGDAARALYAAVRSGRRLKPEALAETTAWLRQPERWEHNGGEGEFSDKKLAVIQFSAALVDALHTDTTLDRAPLKQAAAMVAAEQEDDGSWRIDAPGALGSPATYGRHLATAAALRVLRAADDPRLAANLDRAERWLAGERPKAILDAAATMIGLHGVDAPAAAQQRRRCLELLRGAQGEAGGWGPYPPSPPEPFDTAVALLALSQTAPALQDEQHAARLARGRRYLIETQRENGSWAETTRPTGAISYAQRLSTTGWATLALLATE